MSKDNWKIYKLGALYNVFSGLSKSRDQFGFGYPFVTFRDVFNNYFLPEKLTSLANTTEKEMMSCSVKKGDIFLTRTSETQDELGMSSVALKDYPNATFNGFTKRLRLKENFDTKIDLLYIGYHLRSPFVRAQIGQHASLTTRASLNSAAINSIEIRLPNFLVQQHIGRILKSLDDKIELNRQTNATLEAIAQALFQEWFVAFNFPGATGEMEESELGLVPKGWRVGRLGELLELQRGFDLPSSTRIPGKFPVIAASGINGYHNECKVKAPGITTGRSGVLGNVFYIQEDFWPLNTSLYVKEFKKATPLFAYFILQQLELKNLNGGSAVPTLNRNEAHKLITIIPEPEIIEIFEATLKPTFQLTNSNEQENQTLTKVRDGLLPRLMKGALIPDHQELILENQ